MRQILPDGERLRLRAVLELELPDDHGCTMGTLCPCIESVDSVTRRETDGHCSITVEGASAGTEERHVEQRTRNCGDRECYFELLERDGIAATVTDIAGRTIRVDAYVRSRQVLTEAIADLSSICSVRTRKLGELDDGGVAELRTINIGALTSTERETLERAVESGYYDEPRRATLSDLTESFGVSEAAVSKRLRSAERKLVTQSVAADD